MTRIITGAVGILILIPACFLSHTILWPLLLSFFAFIAVDELAHCVGMQKETRFLWPARIFSLLPLYTWLLTECFPLMDPFRVIFLFSALFFITEQIVGIFDDNRLESAKLYSYVALILYAVVAFTAIVVIRFIDEINQEGKYIYLLVLFGGWISDTFAYFTGMAIGKRKLCPSISPKKTVEGSIGGVVANMITFAGYGFVLEHFFNIPANLIFFAILGALFSAVGQFGDLFASAIKRHYGVKDYGKLFPGHGGVMDRFDSTLAIAVVMLIVYAAVGAGFLMR